MFVVTALRVQHIGKDTPTATEQITREVESGRLDFDAVSGVMTACGLPRKFPSLQNTVSSLQVTQREQEVLAHLARGSSNKEIARKLGISPSTAGTHVENLYRKLGVSTRAAAALIASKQGLVS